MGKYNFFDEMEIKGARLLSVFNDSVGWFSTIQFSKRGSVIDAVAEDVNNRKVHIELKCRQGKYKNFTEFCKFQRQKGEEPTIFIETGKLSAFARIMQSGFSLNEQELFINLFDDGKTVVIFDLNQPIHCMSWEPNKRVSNKGTGEVEYEHRIGLPVSQALIYRYDEEEDTFKKVELPF